MTEAEFQAELNRLRPTLMRFAVLQLRDDRGNRQGLPADVRREIGFVNDQKIALDEPRPVFTRDVVSAGDVDHGGVRDGDGRSRSRRCLRAR